MELPLIERMQESATPFFPPIASDDGIAGAFCGAAPSLHKLPTPGPGEQYRFHFDMTKCIGCKCCVVACNEQNGNPADILWRRVGEIEGGSYPFTRRHYLSIGCNHCLDPTCMTGCPVDAYSKDGLTGIVRHSADACIGCQYCTWNCSYGVPQYNPERGVVGKCDMCYGRLARGQGPACISACPEDAIQIELVNIAEWRTNYGPLANSPGMPSADDSLSTTRITLPASAGNLRKVDIKHLRVEDAHWPLIFMTVLTQFSVGVFSAIAWMQFTANAVCSAAALVALAVACAALCASTLHLGRPLHAARALKMWRRSWLSREVLLFTLFASSATIYSGSLLFQFRSALFVGICTVLLGLSGVAASARLYLAPGRPAWNSPITFLEFFATAFLLGVAGANVLISGSAHSLPALLLAAATSAVGLALKLLWLRFAGRYELFASWQLLSSILLNKLLVRIAMLVVGVCIFAAGRGAFLSTLGLLLIATGEFMGRYLFFVSVVPSNIASGYLAQEAA